MLRSLVSSTPSHSQKKEDKKAIKEFKKLLDSRMESKDKVLGTGGEIGGAKRKESGQNDDIDALRQASQQKKLDPVEALEERKKALLFYDREVERRKLENLERLRLENEKNKMKMQEKNIKTGRHDTSGELLGKRQPYGDEITHKKPSGYNPLATGSKNTETKQKSKPDIDPNDPARDPRFMFSFSTGDQSDQTRKKKHSAQAYNPLGTQRPVGIQD